MPAESKAAASKSHDSGWEYKSRTARLKRSRQTAAFLILNPAAGADADRRPESKYQIVCRIGH